MSEHGAKTASSAGEEKNSYVISLHSFAARASNVRELTKSGDASQGGAQGGDGWRFADWEDELDGEIRRG